MVEITLEKVEHNQDKMYFLIIKTTTTTLLVSICFLSLYIAKSAGWPIKFSQTIHCITILEQNKSFIKKKSF